MKEVEEAVEETVDTGKANLSQEDLKQMRSEAVAYYKDRNPVLKLQLEHEKLLADIEEEKLRGLLATVRQAQIMAPAPEVHAEEQELKSTQEKPRTLKKD
jgi:hypothetical protein